MADITQDSFNEDNRFTKVIFQRGKDVRDSELNEFQDIIRVMNFRAMWNSEQVPGLDPGSNDTGWLVVGTGASNQVTIDAGFLFCDGIPIENDTSFTETGFTTPGSDRTDTVYLAVTETEVADPSAAAQLGVTTMRRQLQVTVAISTTGHAGVPSNTGANIWEGGVHYFIIADVARHSGVATINANDVTDLRAKLAPSILTLITDQTRGFLEGAWEFTVGDGTHSFGDFTGTDAIESALVAAAVRGWTNLTIHVKRGTYSPSVSIAVPATGTLELIGDDGAVTINGVSGSATITAGTGTTLKISKCKVLGASGEYAVDATSADYVEFDHANVGATAHIHNVATALHSHSLVARDTVFSGNTTNKANVEGLYTVDSKAWFFERCRFVPTSQPPIRMTAATQALGRPALLDEIEFETCRFELSTTTTTTSGKTTGVLTVNTGLVDFDPGGQDARGTNGLKIGAIRYFNCRGYANGDPTAALENVLLHLIPTANGTNAAASTSPWLDLGVLQFSDCRFEATYSQYWAGGSGPYNHGPASFVAAGRMDVIWEHSEIVFNQNTSANSSGGWLSDDTGYLFGTGTSAPGAGGSGNFSIATSGELKVDDLTLSGLIQGASVPDVRLHCESIVVNKWKAKYVAFTGSKRPYARFWFTAPDFGAEGVIRDLELIGTTAGSSDWFAGSQGAAVVVSCYAGNQQEPELRFERPIIKGFRDSGGSTTTMNGFTLEDGSLTSGVTGLGTISEVDGIAIDHPYIERTGEGIAVIVGSGNGINNIRIKGGTITNCASAGIFMEGNGGNASFGIAPCEIDGVNIRTCTSYGINIQGDFSPGECFAIMRNHVRGNNGGVGNAQIQVASTGSALMLMMYHNRTNGGIIKLSKNSGSAINATATRSGVVQTFGCETAASVADPTLFNFTNGNAMMHNEATLQTP